MENIDLQKTINRNYHYISHRMTDFSVLLSVYYKEKPDYLRQSLDSVFSQTVRASQVILVEDGPLTPELNAIVTEYCVKYPELETVPLSENKGLGLALAEGIKHCQYELVARMDTDDIARKDRFELQLQQFEKNPNLDICGSHVQEFEGTPDNIVTKRMVPLTDEECKKYQRRRDAFNHMTVMYKKSAVLAAGNYQHCPLMEDTLLWVNMFKNGSVAMNIDDYLVYARIGEGMYERRGGWAYFKKYKQARKRIYETGYISWWDYMVTLAAQFVVSLLPNRLRGGYLSTCCTGDVRSQVARDEYQVAVVIPTLNEELHIKNCIDSIISQSFPFAQMNLMVIDGGSTDKTREIVKSIAEQYSNVRLLDNPKRIQSVAFNVGVANSSAPYIVRLDAHALYKPKYIELCVKHLESNKEIGDVGGVWDIQPQNGGLIPETNAIINKSRFGIGGAAYRVGAEAGYVDTVPFGAFPRHVVEEIGGMREDMPRAEDNEYIGRIKKAGYKVYLDPKIECVYYSRGTINSFLKQKFADGKSIGHLFYISRDAISLRHFVPLAFVLSLVFLAICAIFSKYALWLLIVELGLYALCDVIAAIYNSLKFGVKFIFTLPWMFPLVHICYGCGTIAGLIGKRQ